MDLEEEAVELGLKTVIIFPGIFLEDLFVVSALRPDIHLTFS
jgi:hypothetical protein